MRYRILLIIWLLLSMTAPGYAQGCDYLSVMKEGSPASIVVSLKAAAFKADIEAARWGEVGDALLQDFDDHSILNEPNRSILRKALEALRKELGKADGISDVSRLETLLDTGKPIHIQTQIFRSSDDREEGRSVFFRGHPNLQVLSVDCGMPEKERMDAYQWIGLGRSLLLSIGEKPRFEAQVAIHSIVGRWNNYLDNGYSQYPWELYFNGTRRAGLIDLEPPRRQWVLLHPSAGVELAGTGAQQRRLDVVMIEPIGHLWYNANRTFYGGVSLVVSAPSNRTPGIGALLHIGKHGKVGYVWRRRDEVGRKQDGAIFSVDLYGWLGDSKAPFKAIRDRLLSTGK